MRTKITGTTSLLGLIGTPVDHSKSPEMYNYGFQKLGFDYTYLAFDVPKENLSNAIDTIKVFKMKGANVTMPHKSEVIKYLDEVSPASRIIGAVNTIVNHNGKLVGHITDGLGYVRNLKEEGISLKNKNITIIGAGGSATAIIVQCALEGAKEISIFNIKDSFFERAKRIVENLNKEVPSCLVNLYDLEDSTNLSLEISTSHILVNCTVIGMSPYLNQSPIKDLSVFRKDLIVTDVIYSPKQTKLLSDASSCGCKTIGGLGMLVWQGAEAFKLYTGEEMPVEEIKDMFFN